MFSIRIDSNVKREFTEAVRAKGLSTCFVAEVLFRAWLEGGKAAAASIVDPSKTIVVNQNITRVVRRARRFYYEIEEEVPVPVPPKPEAIEVFVWRFRNVKTGEEKGVDAHDAEILRGWHDWKEMGLELRYVVKPHASF